MRTLGLLLLFLVCAESVGDVRVHELGETHVVSHFNSDKHIERQFMEVARNIQDGKMKETLLMDAVSVNSMKTRSGLTLINKKLAELVEKMEAEGVVDLGQAQAARATCTKQLQKSGRILGTASAAEASNNMKVSSGQDLISSNHQEWERSRQEEEKIQREFMNMVGERFDEVAMAKERIDERNKAIDVLVKATFIVCEKFNRFKTTQECLSIKARPDANEPGQPVFPPSPTEQLPVAWGNSSTVKVDAEKTATYEASQAEAWAQKMLFDVALEGNENPENLPTHTVNKRGNAQNNEAAAHQEIELMEDAGEEDKALDWTLNKEEHNAVKQLKTLGSSHHIGSKYTLPINELAVALGEGKPGRTKSIIMILLDVKKITEDEQLADKLQYVAKLEDYYKRSWQIKAILDSEEERQRMLEGSSENSGVDVNFLMQDTSSQRETIRTETKFRIEEEDRCRLLDDAYGEREGVRQEDFESIKKLLSLLRSLYDKTFPRACPMSKADTPVMCTGEAHGWCIWTENKGKAQRCSCNQGYYGKACGEFMCPGVGHVNYKVGQEGVCSNNGSCDSTVGQCACAEGFYHGPKKACENKHCPKSVNGIVDNKCSSHGTCDIKRAHCHCDYGWSGDGCQFKGCPNGNGVLYPHTSHNACDGHGVCNPTSGSCSCKAPFYGEKCDVSECPRGCMGRGGCDSNTGKCKCPEGYWGAACEFVTCPDDCSGGGECNRHSGKCLCRDGFSGARCRKSTRCPAEMGEGVAVRDLNWYTQWDKPGWVTCPNGQSLYALRRNSCEALDCLEGGSCASPCEGQMADNAEVIQTRHCYHDLNVYFSMDTEGWSKCEANYYISGFYRTGSSLYQLQMFKCCSYKASRWSQCTDTNWATAFDFKTKVEAPEHKFLAGLYRGKAHKLSSVDRGFSCGWVRGY